MFVPNSDITIGSFRFSGVNNLQIKRSMHSICDTATITLPARSKIIKGLSSSPAIVSTGDLFQDGDPVTMLLGYNGDLREEFKGFVRRRNLGIPMVIECEGYVRVLRQDIDVTAFYKEAKMSDLLNLLTKDKSGKSTGISIVVKNDIPLHNIKLTHANGETIIQEIKKVTLGVINIFFINPTTLWAGLVYTPISEKKDPFVLGKVNLELGWNVVKDNSLKERVVEGEPVQVLIGSVMPTGAKVQTSSEAKYAKRKEQAYANNIREKAALQMMATEMQYQKNYTGYEGNITAFLQPYCLPGYTAFIKDSRYPEKDGDYIIESTEVQFGVRGARRKIEIGPLIGFNPNPKQ